LKFNTKKNSIAKQIKKNEKDILLMFAILNCSFFLRSFEVFEIDIDMQLESKQENKL